MIKTRDLYDALLSIDLDYKLRGSDLVDVGREICRSNGTVMHWRSFAMAREMDAEHIYSLWEQFRRNPEGPDVIERMLPPNWEPTPMNPWDSFRLKDEVHYLAEHVIAPPTTSIGVSKLDESIGGITAGTYTVVGGEGGAGKTALALNAAYAAIVANKYLPIVYSAEVTAKECYDRLLSIHTRATGMRQVFWSLTQEQVASRIGADRAWELWNKLGYERKFAVDSYVERYADSDPVLLAYGDFQERYGSRIAIRETGISCDAICREVRDLTNAGLKVFPIIDHIHAIEPPQGKEGKEYDEVSAISAALMALTKECRIPLLALSELRNIGDKERDEPQLTWFRGSGRIGYDAGCAIILARDGERQQDGQPIVAHVIKNRRGSVGDKLKLTFSGSIQEFR